MSDLFGKMESDPQVRLPWPSYANATKRLVEQLPSILKELLVAKVTVSSLMQAQHKVIEYLLAAGEDVAWWTALSDTVADWRDADLVIDLRNLSPSDFFHQAFLSTGDIERLEAGQLTIGELLQSKPQAFIAPLLRTIKQTRH